MNDKGTYDIFSAVVDGDELRDLMGDLNSDLDEAVVRPETGPRKVPGSDCGAGSEMENEDQTSDNMPDIIKAIVRRAMKPGLKFAGDEAGSKQKPSTSLTENKKKKLSEDVRSDAIARFKSVHGSTFDPKSRLDQSKLASMMGSTASTSTDAVPMPRPRPAAADTTPIAAPKPVTPTTAPATSTDTFKPKLSAYSPQKGGSSMEGGYASSKPGPDKQSVVRTLDDYASGRSQHVTLAGHPSQYGKEYTIPSMKYTNSAGEKQELKNVRGVVHDTGSAFKGQDAASGQRFDVAVGRDYGSKQLSSQPWSMKSDVEFKPGWTPSEPEKKIQTASLDENMPAQTLGEKPKPAQWNLEEDDDTPDSVIPKTSSTSQPSQAERQAGMEKLKGAMNTQIKQNMDRYVDNLKKQDFINRATQEPPKKGQYDI